MTDAKDMHDLLDKVIDWMRYMKKQISVDATIKTMSPRTVSWLLSIDKMYWQHSKEDRQKIGDRVAETEGGEIFTNYMRVLTDGGTKIPDSGCDNYRSLHILRGVLWNYSNVSFALCLELGKAGAFHLFVADLLTYKTSVADGMRNGVVRQCMAILHNCAKVPENFKYFKQANALKAVLPYTKIENTDLLRCKVEAILTLSYFVEDRNNEAIMADGSVLTFILNYLKNAIETMEHKFNGFSAEELVDGLLHLANNDDNKVSIADAGVFQMLVKLLKTGSDYERILCLGLVWTLSFAKQNQLKIQEDKNIMGILNKLKDEPGKIGNCAAGALWTLSESEQESVAFIGQSGKGGISCENIVGAGTSATASPLSAPVSDVSPIKAENVDHITESLEHKMTPKQEKMEAGVIRTNSFAPEHGHVMISYNWQYQKLMIKIKERLEQLNYDVWLDIEKMKGSITDVGALLEKFYKTLSGIN